MQNGIELTKVKNNHPLLVLTHLKTEKTSYRFLNTPTKKELINYLQLINSLCQNQNRVEEKKLTKNFNCLSKPYSP